MLTCTFLLIFRCCRCCRGRSLWCSTFYASCRRHYACNNATDASINTDTKRGKTPLIAQFTDDVFTFAVIALAARYICCGCINLQGYVHIDLCNAYIGYYAFVYHYTEPNIAAAQYGKLTKPLSVLLTFVSIIFLVKILSKHK